MFAFIVLLLLTKLHSILKKSIKILLFFFLYVSIIQAQVKIIKPLKVKKKETNFGISAGLVQSVIYLSRNVNNKNDARGLNVSINYDQGNFFRLIAEYSQFNKMTIEPTWSDIKAKTIELNAAFIAKTSDRKFYFYPITGFSYNTFSGYYTGIRDYLNLSSLYEKNTFVISNWIGVNVGCGLDFNFQPFSIFANYKMRIGNTEGYNEKNIQDVSIALGLRYNIKGATLYKLFRGTRSRYTLKTKESN